MPLLLHSLLLAIAANPDLLPSTPPPSAGHAMVYHDSLGVVLLLNAGLGSSDDARRAGEATRIWAWRNLRWELVDSSGPPLRNLAGVAYDSHRNRIVMHGGSSVTGSTFDETWEWGGRWERRDGTGPGLRDHVAMAYDPGRRRTVLFGGQAGSERFPPETWEWDGTRWNLTAQSGPPARVHYGMQYDPVTTRVIVFGGIQPGVARLGDTWSYNGTGWEKVGAAAPRTHVLLAWHGGLRAITAIGGFGVRGGAPVLSTWSGSAWTDAAGESPPARYLAAAAWDARRGVLVMFGGGNPGGSDLFADTWEHDGTTWVRR